MSEWPVFECDVTGERFGAKNDVQEYELRRHGRSEYHIASETVHVARDVLPPLSPSGIKTEFIAIDASNWTVDGIVIDGAWRPRDSVVISHYERFFRLLEEEVLYG